MSQIISPPSTHTSVCLCVIHVSIINQFSAGQDRHPVSLLVVGDDVLHQLFLPHLCRHRRARLRGRRPLGLHHPPPQRLPPGGALLRLRGARPGLHLHRHPHSRRPAHVSHHDDAQAVHGAGLGHLVQHLTAAHAVGRRGLGLRCRLRQDMAEAAATPTPTPTVVRRAAAACSSETKACRHRRQHGSRAAVRDDRRARIHRRQRSSTAPPPPP